MSIVVLEAGMAGTPVLLTDRCGFDQVASVDGGRVVPATAEALANGMDRLLGEPRAMRKMGENLRVFAATEFSWDALVPKYVALYESILSSRCRAA
jgi:glycosyltransferase involved in cell wall biosynthesis